MIKKHVVFLLGAGASRGYGYPTGGQLMTRLTAVNGDQLTELEALGGDRARTIKFQGQLRDCGLSSVDAFLKRNPSFAREAKIRIAQELTEAERGAAKRQQRDDSWVQYLYANFMDGGSVNALRDNQCAFVTLNYDRSLEFELTKMLSNSYGVTWEEAAGAVSSLATIHLHGAIGPLPKCEVEYGAPRVADEMAKAAQSILTLGEPGSDEAYEKAKRHLQTAQTIISLGFGYHDEIIEKLGLRGGTTRLGVHGSCQGLTQAEVNHVSGKFSPRQFVELLRDGVIWNHRAREPGPAVDYIRANVGLLE